MTTPAIDLVVEVATDYGVILGQLNIFELSYTKAVNSVGWFELSVPGTLDFKFLNRDYQFRFWMHRPGMNGFLDFFGLLRRFEFIEEADGSEYTLLSGTDQNGFLERRIVPYDADSDEAEVSVSNVDDAMKDIVNENFVNPTDTARELDGLIINPDLGLGPDVQKQFSWQSVINTLQDLQLSSREAGDEIFFEIGVNSIGEYEAIVFEFLTYKNQPRDDRTAGTNNSPIIFATEYGNLIRPRLVYSYNSEISYAYVAGQGEGAERALVEVESAGRSAGSRWNRIEMFTNGSRFETTEGLTSEGERLLSEHRPKRLFNAGLKHAERTPYGDWNLGTKVTALYRSDQYNGVIRSISVRQSAGGAVEIEAEMEGEF